MGYSVIERTGKAKELFDEAFKALSGNLIEGIDHPDYAKAITLFSEVIKLMPNDWESYNNRGYNYYHQLGQKEKAIADLDKAISLNPKNAEGYSIRAVVYIAFGKIEEAKADIEKAVELAPKGAGVSYNAFGAELYKLTGNKSEAAVYLKKSVEHGDAYGLAKKKLAEWGM